MNGRRLTLWRRIVAFAPALLLVVCLPGQMMLRCRLDGTLRAACCCPQAAAEAGAQGEGGASAPSRLTSQGCCERTVIEGRRPAAEAARPHEMADAAWAAAVDASWVTVLDPAPRRPSADRAGQRYRPPREGPRLIVLKQSFLI